MSIHKRVLRGDLVVYDVRVNYRENGAYRSMHLGTFHSIEAAREVQQDWHNTLEHDKEILREREEERGLNESKRTHPSTWTV